MRIVSACIYALKIPFTASFSHNLGARNCSDSVLVKLTTDSGISGFGEGVPRSYVTGETQSTSAQYIRNELIPRIIGLEIDNIGTQDALAHINGLLSVPRDTERVVWNASRCAVELAFIDCLFRSRNISINAILPPRVREVSYSGVISSGPATKVANAAQQCKVAGLKHIKIKVSNHDDIKKIALVRDILGSSISIRLDANGAFERNSIVRFLSLAEKYDIECIEQPIPPGNASELAAIRSSSTIPVMADESIVTMRDAIDLITAQAVDHFNLRISKCGGLYNTLCLVALAKSAGVGLQLGCHVGETAVLSAAGRHVAANLPILRFLEGSYGKHLLKEDIAQEDIRFGSQGVASVLTGTGLGINVQESTINRFAKSIIRIE